MIRDCERRKTKMISMREIVNVRGKGREESKKEKRKELRRNRGSKLG